MKYADLAEMLHIEPASVTWPPNRAEPDTVLNGEQQLNASEAVIGFAGWLTSRPTTVTWGADHEADSAAQAVEEFTKANGLPAVRDDYTTRLKIPPERHETPQRTAHASACQSQPNSGHARAPADQQPSAT